VERLQSPPQVIEGGAAARIPKERDPERLHGLIAAALSASIESERHLLATEINQLLEAMRAPGNEAAEARAVLTALDLNTLEGLVDEVGRNCRAEAVETLLACGFPHALELRPEDLKFRDQERDKRRKTVRNRALVSGCAAAGVAGVLVSSGNVDGAVGALVVGAPLLAMLAFAATMRFEQSKSTAQPQPEERDEQLWFHLLGWASLFLVSLYRTVGSQFALLVALMLALASVVAWLEVGDTKEEKDERKP
jgi:hypothetical protein